MVKPVRPGNCLLLAGVLFLAALASCRINAAHEPEPVVALPDVEGWEVPSPAPELTEPLIEQNTDDVSTSQGDDLSISQGDDALQLAPAASPSPAPHMATILPLMPMILPGCPNNDILDSTKPQDFPKNWDSLTVEQQALHPINLLLMNMVGVPSTDLLTLVNPCLYSWGVVKGSVTKIARDYKVGNSLPMKTIVLVFRTKKNVWVVFRPTDDDWVADFDCMYTDDLRKTLNVPTPLFATKKLQLHRGFWAAYSAVEKPLMQEINKQLKLVKGTNLFAKPQVWLAGHSLAGALASIAAFRMEYDPWLAGHVAGVVTFGSPRVGNELWQHLYNAKLRDKTLRWNNHRDLFAALPAKGQFCLSSSPLKTVFSFRHVGRAVLLCPSVTQPGLQEFRFFPEGTETSCMTGETLIIGTHLLGHYFDGWRRAYAERNGLSAAAVLSGGPHVRSVMCTQCAIAVKQYPLPDNKAARNDGVVSCVDDSSCNDRDIFSVVSWAGLWPTAFFRSDAVCDGPTALCQVPSAALTQVQNALLEIAPNITAAVGAFASKALANNPVAMFFSGMSGIPGFNMSSFAAAYHSNSSTEAEGQEAPGSTDDASEDAEGLDEQSAPSGEDSSSTGGELALASVATATVYEAPGGELIVEPVYVRGHLSNEHINSSSSSSTSSSNSTSTSKLSSADEDTDLEGDDGAPGVGDQEGRLMQHIADAAEAEGVAVSESESEHSGAGKQDMLGSRDSDGGDVADEADTEPTRQGSGVFGRLGALMNDFIKQLQAH